jgi:hypothetical protein
MRIRDLIPDRDALITPDFYRRKNLLVQVIEDDESDAAARPPSGIGPGGTRTASQRGHRRPATASTPRQRPQPAPQTLGTDRAGQPRALGAGPADPRCRAAPSTGQPRRRPRPRRPLSAARRGAVRGAELGLRDDRAPQPRPQHAGDRLQPRQGGAPGRRGEQHRARPGDVVTVYSQKDVRVPVARQTRWCRSSGEVGSPGVYQLQPARR